MRNDWTEWRIVVVGSVLTMAGSAILFLLPVYLGSMTDDLSLDPAKAGLLSGVEIAAIALTSLSGPLWIRRVNWRLAAIIGVVGAIIGNSLTMMTDSYHLILIFRVITGLFGEGVIYTLSFAVIAEMKNPDRGFGIALTVAVAIMAIILLGAPMMVGAMGRDAMVLVVSVLMIIVLPILSWMPRMTRKVRVSSQGSKETNAASTILMPLFGLGTLALWFVGPSGFWAFLERIGAAKGLTSQEIGNALAIGITAGLVGAMIPVVLGLRFGRIYPLILATVVMAAIAVGTLVKLRAELFILYLVLFNVVWNMGTAYFFASIASADRGGFMSVLTPAFQCLGFSAGPALMGYYVNGYGFAAILWIFIATGILSMVLFIPFEIRSTRLITKVHAGG